MILNEPFGFADILGIRIHIWSLLVFAIFVIVVLIRLRKLNPIFSLTITCTMFLFISFLNGILFDFLLPSEGWFLYLLYTITISIFLIMMNRHLKFLRFNKWFISLGILHISIYVILYYSGFFAKLNVWFYNDVPDPHGLFWMMHKALGYWMWIPLIKNDYSTKSGS